MKYYCKCCGLSINDPQGIDPKHLPRCIRCSSLFITFSDYEKPEQYEKRTGNPYPKTGAVFFRILDDPSDSFNDWTLLIYADALQYELESEEADCAPTVYIVIADPPVPPPADWRQA